MTLGIVFAVLLASLRSISRDVLLLRGELERNDSEWDALRQGLYRLADDVLETREVLRLPSRQYRFSEEASESELSEDAIVPYVKGVDVLIEMMQREESGRAMETLRGDARFLDFLASHSLQLFSSDKELQLQWEHDTLFRIRYKLNPPRYQLLPLHHEAVPAADIRELVDEMERLLSPLQEEARTKNDFRRLLQDFPDRREVQELHEAYGLNAGALVSTPEALILPVEKAGEQVLAVSFNFFDMRFHFLDKTFASVEMLATAYLQHVETHDLLTAAEQAFLQVLRRVETALNDEGIRSYLEDYELYLSDEARSDEEHVFFDFEDSEGNRAGSLAVHRYTLEVWIMDRDDVPVTSLRSLSLSSFPSSYQSPFVDRGDALTVLVAGLHENLADTIILAHFEKNAQTAYLFSVPRDLFYRGRKLNTLYKRYGQEGFVDELAKITGMEIDHYVFIDMFAFIEVVDALGGIDVYLRESLIDPTYKVKNDGRWSTLYYGAGVHHLGGREALRIARSRHTSDDFGRAARQQLILQALFSKVVDIGIGEVDKLYDFAKIAVKYVETDLNPFQVVSYASAANGIRSFQQAVIDTSNILYSTYSNLYYSGKTEEEVDESFQKGAWILLPLDNDWQLIPAFVQNFILRKDLLSSIPSDTL